MSSQLTLDFDYRDGSVVIGASGMPAGGGGYVVKRALPNTATVDEDLGPWTLYALRGYENDDDWVDPLMTSGIARDYEMPLGIKVYYVLVKDTQTSADINTKPLTYIETPKDRAWLRDVMSPVLSQPVVVIATDPVNRVGRQSVYQIAGRKAPVVVWDVRQTRTGTITLLVKNQTADLYRQTRRDKIEALLQSNRPVLLSMDHAKGFDPCWMAIGDARFARVGQGPTWQLELDYNEVDNPIEWGSVALPMATYSFVSAVPFPAATYLDWNNTPAGTYTFRDYFDLSDGEPG